MAGAPAGPALDPERPAGDERCRAERKAQAALSDDCESLSKGRPRCGKLDRMTYGVEWMGGTVVSGIVLLVLIVPEFAAIAIVVATIGALAVALVALVGLVALAAAALASPYLLVRGVRRRRDQRRTRRTQSPSGIRSRPAGASPAAYAKRT